MAIKTNERPGTRAVLRHAHISSYKVREVLDLVRNVKYSRAIELLDHTDRGAAPVVAKLLRSAAANAEHNEGLDPEELYVATCYADEGTTMKRWRPRARGRATRIRKRTCHITVVLARMPDDQIARLRARHEAEAADRRARRVAGTRRGRGEEASSALASPAPTAAGTAPSEVEPEAVVEPAVLEPAVPEQETQPQDGDPQVGEAQDMDPADTSPEDPSAADSGAADLAGDGGSVAGEQDSQNPGEDS
jgi:large subunit ribosomal protein L22